MSMDVTFAYLRTMESYRREEDTDWKEWRIFMLCVLTDLHNWCRKSLLDILVVRIKEFS